MPPKREHTLADVAQQLLLKCRHFCTLLQQEGLPDDIESRGKAESLITSLQSDFELNKRGRQPDKVLTKQQHLKQRWYLKRKVGVLQTQMRAATEGKLNGRIQNVWLVRVAFSDALLSARSLSSWCCDFGVEPSKVISHSYIARVKDCFCQLVKSLNKQEIALQALNQPVANHGDASKPFFVVHQHDEASMRVRSWDASVQGRIIRGRSSKIQNQVVQLHFNNSSSWEWFAELVPLLSKDGASIAETLVCTLVDILETLVPIQPPPWKHIRVVHILVGDSINTNLNSAKRLLRYFKDHRDVKGMNVKYGLLSLQCASHIINLVVMVAIVGDILSEPTERDDVCAAASRFFKYLVHDYLEEYNRALKTFLINTVQVLPGPLDTDKQREVEALQALYGCNVLPPSLLQILNGDLQSWTHTSNELSQGQVVERLFHLLSKLFFFIEERPVPTRFWLFGNCVRRLLLMKLIGLPATVLQLQGANPQEDSQKRLRRFLTFYTSDMATQRLKQATLCLSLTEYALNITGQKRDAAGIGDGEMEPLLVRLSRGEIETKTGTKLVDIFGQLQCDTTLEHMAAITGLLLTQGHLLMRLDIYKKFPYCLWRLTQRFNSQGCVLAVEEFLETPDDELDAGYSLELKMEALRQGTLAAAMAYLLASDIQDELVQIFEHASCTSLDVERKHYQDRKSEGRKYMSVSRASRNSILSRYNLRRKAQVGRRLAIQKVANSMRYMSSSALAVKDNPSWLPRPAGFHTTSHAGNPEALQAYRQQHGVELKAKAAKMRKTAKDMLVSLQSGGMPVTNADWLSWLEEHEEEFRQTLRTAVEERRPLSQRLCSKPDDFPAASRIGPKFLCVPAPSWFKKLLQFRKGWFCLDIGEILGFFSFPRC